MQRGDAGLLVAAGGFEDDVDVFRLPQKRQQPGVAFGVIGERVGAALEIERQGILGNIEARVDGGLIILTHTCPSALSSGPKGTCEPGRMQIRPAHSTVRVWSNGGPVPRAPKRSACPRKGTPAECGRGHRVSPPPGLQTRRRPHSHRKPRGGWKRTIRTYKCGDLHRFAAERTCPRGGSGCAPACGTPHPRQQAAFLPQSADKSAQSKALRAKSGTHT